MLENSQLVRSARLFATWAHDGQLRKTGGEYIAHPARVAAAVRILPGATEEMVAAAWLHDTVEDTKVTSTEIQNHFGSRVAILVRGLTDRFTSEIYPEHNRADRKKWEAHRLARTEPDVRAIKRCDMADNLRDIDDFPGDFGKIFRAEKEYLIQLFDEEDAIDSTLDRLDRKEDL